MSERDAFVVAARRTPIGKLGGALRLLRVESLVAPLIRAVLTDAGLAATDVDEVVLGNVWGPGGNPARVAALTAGIDARVPGLTIDRQCASGLEAINLAARLVQTGAAGVCLAGGVESASTAPWRIDRPDSVYQTPAFSTRARFAPDAAGDPEMGPAADALARAHGVSRERQDRFALSSHRKAIAAAREGRFASEIVALPASNRAAALPPPPEGWEGAVEQDQSPRARLTLRTLGRFPPAFATRARFAPEAAGDPEMGPAADALARAHGVSRERQDRFALSSHRKAVAAAREGRFAGEIVALPVSNRAAALPRPPDGWEGAVERDQSPRARLTLRTLARFPPVFSPDGTVTAGNASPINDGAALVAVVSGAVLRRLGAPALRIVDGVAAGVDPALPGGGPIAATTALLRRNPGVDLSDVGVVEITEAFAGQALACLDALGIAEERANVGGGAIALGHPWGASGAVLVCRLFTEMLRAGNPTPPPSGVATVAGAGGVGVATLVERVTPA